MARPREIEDAELVTLRVPRLPLEAVNKAAEVSGRPRSEVMREILESGVQDFLRHALEECLPRERARLTQAEAALRCDASLLRLYRENKRKDRVHFPPVARKATIGVGSAAGGATIAN